MARLLVVEDDAQIGRLLLSALSACGHDADWEQSGAGALSRASTEDFDLVLLDVGLPDLDGVEVCRELRRLHPAVVIVMLTARLDEMDVVSALESGADDYLTKPFRFVELLARISAHLRRPTMGSMDEPSTQRLGALRLDLRARRCWLGTIEVQLRSKELELLARLLQDVDAALRREVLMADVWDENWFGSTKTLDVHVASLRRKLTDAALQAGVEAPVISTLRGHGYRLERSTQA